MKYSKYLDNIQTHPNTNLPNSISQKASHIAPAAKITCKKKMHLFSVNYRNYVTAMYFNCFGIKQINTISQLWRNYEFIFLHKTAICFTYLSHTDETAEYYCTPPVKEFE